MKLLGSRIGLNVTVAFSIIVIVMIAAAFSAWLSFTKLKNQIQDINQHQLPIIFDAAQFAEISGSITATAPRLLMASSSWEQDSIWLTLQGQLEQLESILHNRPSTQSKSQAHEIFIEIENNIEALNLNVSRLFDLKRKQREMLQALRWIQASFLDEIYPALSDSKFNTSLILNQLINENELRQREEITDLLSQENAIGETLMQVNVDINLMTGLIMRAANQTTIVDINQTEQHILSVNVQLQDSIIKLNNLSSTISIRQSASEVLLYGVGDEGLLSLSREQVLLHQNNLDLVNQSKDLVRALKKITTDQLEYSKKLAALATSEAQQSVERGRSQLIFLLIIGLAISFVIGWYYVGIRLIGRLNLLRRNMAAIASGDFEVKIALKGQDEITQMAKALVVFRNTAIKVEQATEHCIIDNAFVGLVSTNENGQIEFINAQAKQLIGLGEDKVFTEDFNHLFIAADERSNLDICAKANSNKTLQTIGVTLAGNEFPLEISIRRYQTRNSIRLLLTLTDVSERELAQQLLQVRIAERTSDLQTTNEKLVSEINERQRTEIELRSAHQELIQATKLASLGQLSASIAHELNQPLNAISYNSFNARTLIERDRVVDAIDSLNANESLVDKMAKMINHLKVFSRKSANEVEPVELSHVITNALSLFESRIQRLGCTVNQPHQTIKHQVYADPIRLEQVLVNLFGNALDAVESNESPIITIKINQHQAQTELQIIDNGEGISEENLVHIFDPFFTTKAVGKGLGLGLSISKKIVNDFGGNLKVTSKLNLGCTMTIWLERIQHNDLQETTHESTIN